MRVPDFSRQDLAFATALSALAGFVFGAWASLTFVQGAVSGAAWTGIIGTVVGGAIGFFGSAYHERKRREREVADLKASIYVEIADRVARCINDYLRPWRDWKPTGADPITAERIAKFRPTDPVVFTGGAGKLGLIPANSLLAVTQFYFRLSALTQAIEALAAISERRERPGHLPIVEQGDQARVRLIVDRLQSCFAPALRALERLDVPEAPDFDQEVTRVYPHLRNSGDSLRAALRKHASRAIADELDGGSKPAED